MEQHASHAASERPVIILLILMLLAYAVAAGGGWLPATSEVGEHPEAGAAAPAVPHYWAVVPFTALLGSIAVLPLLQQTSHWWERNLSKFYVAATLAMLTLGYIAFLHPDGSMGRAADTLTHTILKDYIPFIVLLFSLYTISGGIRIAGDLPAHSLTNLTFMAIGAVLASFIGTTGAAMLLIRPLLETNRERKNVAHTVVFFIFIVCNCGGLLLPLGDPPLFLGYLNGVDFLWTTRLWKEWALVNGLLLTAYFLWDHFYSYPREAASSLVRDESRVHRLRFAGVWPNAFLLAGIVLSVAFLDPGKTLPGTNWQPWFFLREAVQLGLVLISFLLGSKHVRLENGFDFLAITEVAVLFVGIFISMQPALEILQLQGAAFGLDTPAKYFWASGSLSSVLDNAPTYLVFFEAAKAKTAEGLAGGETMAGVAVPLLIGVSLGSVMMGAMTYIGNGPNFMVKTIAEKAGVPMPSFFAYMLYSFGVLLPILALNVWLFL